ncbi:SusC/RagA family TonB-linked outer membrane protein [Flavivirga eckloniae]|uniref:SusC/RagA family TonB-linked outer membrane protein n=1 Tax=Flavivirga eckloniae TaxID=1803846 RepID=A0A2K9PQ00_9FLAO|nr:SusC/RagA family TonB-linked outer membrane protein [Flavivirga eckloniae]AUP79116.1 hypothetical protein C1H87_10560 [Flavivirga eckloniae]
MKIKLTKARSLVRKRLLFIIMRTLIFLLCTTVFSFTTKTSFSQEKVTIDTDKEVPVDEVFNIIRDQTKYRFLYPQDLFANAPKVQLKKGVIQMSKLLEQCFSGSNVKFELSKDHTIVIKEKPPQQLIKGEVNDGGAGLPLPGVSILIKGTTVGTFTDFDGKYQIRANQGDVLVFSFLGFTTQEITVTDISQAINVNLKATIGVLDEVIVTAQGIKKDKKALGYAVTTLAGRDVENKAESDVSRSLIGKVAGVQINVGSGATGSEAEIRIRDNLSINNGNSPLIVVDNVPFNGGLIDINPNNIKTVSVLKGLNASILYGSDGRNGVILITTKSGSASIGEEKVSINFSQTMYTNQVANLPDYQNKFGQGNDNAYDDTSLNSWGPAFSELDLVPHPLSNNQSFPEFADVQIPYQAVPNNVKDFFDTGIGTVTALNISSSQEKTAFNLSLGYTDETGIIGNNDLKRFNLGLGGSVQITDKWNVSATFNYTARERNFNGGLFDVLLFLPRSLDLRSLPFEDPGTGENVYYRDEANPLWTIDNVNNNDRVVRLFSTLNTKYEFNNNWSVNYRIGIDADVSDSFDTTNRGAFGNNESGRLSLSYDRDEIIDQSLILNTKYQLTNKLGLDGKLGLNSRTINVLSNSSDFQDQDLLDFFRPDNFNTQTGDASRARENLLGAFAQLDFNYDRFLFLSLSGRNDWSSTIEKENQSIFYPGVSVSFLPTSAFNFDSKVVNYLKLRAAYATSSGFPGRFRTRATFRSEPFEFITANGAIRSNSASSTLPNSNLKPELHREFEIGIESKLFNNRVTLQASAYKRSSKDQIVTKRIDASVGFSQTVTNIGRVDGEGLEIELGVDIINNDRFKWNMANVFTAYTTEVVELNAPINLGNGGRAIEGQPFGVFEGTYAVRDNQGNFLINPNNGELIVSSTAGLDNEVIGDPTPDWRLTNINSFSYKNFTLTAQLEYTQGGDQFSGTAIDLLSAGVTKDTENRDGTFTIPGVYGDIGTGQPLLDTNGQTIPNNVQLNASRLASGNYYEADDRKIFDSTLFRIREIALSYNLDGAKYNLPFDNLAITLSGRNVFYKAPNYPKYTNIDPDVGGRTTSTPSTKRYALGVSVSF